MSFLSWLQRRERGQQPDYGEKDHLMKRIYQSIDSYHHWNDFSDKPNQMSPYGAVFNLEFSPEGTVLVAACEKRSIVLFDAVTNKQINHVIDAHTDNVNCIRFLNDCTFASCSDDTTVALWDMRYLKMKMRSLHGHSNWVKNVEYSMKDNLLVTSGFDGGIFTWDINAQTEQGLVYQKVFHTSGLMRCRISPDGTKLVICTTGGYLMIVHNLDLTSLHRDLCGFRPSIYRLMQTGQQYIPQAAKFDHVFSKKQLKNRVEFITDFPEDNDAEVILALQIHPQGHAILSRNISYDELTEWSCVHEMCDEPEDRTEESDDEPASKRRRSRNNEDEEVDILNDVDVDINAQNDILFSINRQTRTRQPPRVIRRSSTSTRTTTNSNNNNSNNAANSASGSNRNNGSNSNNNNNNNSVNNGNSVNNRNNANNSNNSQQAAPSRSEFVPDIWAAEVTVQDRAIRQSRARNSFSVSGYNFVYAISSGVLPNDSANARLRNNQLPGTTSAAASSITINNNNNNNNSNNGNNNSSSSSTSTSNSTSTSSGGSGSSGSSNRLSNNDTTASNDPNSLRYGALIHVNSNRGRYIQFIPRRFLPLVTPTATERKILQNRKKLMFYIQELNKGKGFIKEPCFSADGRIICSPHATDVRLLGFNEDCSEYPIVKTYSQSKRNPPRPLTEIKTLNSHTDIVLSSKFSPREPLLVTGDRGGKIAWYHTNF